MTTSLVTATPSLVVLGAGSELGRRIDLDAERMIVGRSTDCDLRLADASLSRTHAALHRRGDTVQVEDLRSSEGTYVNGERLTAPRVLQPGDVVRFARIQARFEVVGVTRTAVIPAQANRAAGRC